MSTISDHLDRVFEPLANCLSREVAVKIVSLRADDELQRRIDYLADQANEGLLTAEEREEYSAYVYAIDMIAILKAKARSLLRST